MVKRMIASSDDFKNGDLVLQDDDEVLTRIPTGRGVPVGSFHRVLTGKNESPPGLEGSGTKTDLVEVSDLSSFSIALKDSSSPTETRSSSKIKEKISSRGLVEGFTFHISSPFKKSSTTHPDRPCPIKQRE